MNRAPLNEPDPPDHGGPSTQDLDNADLVLASHSPVAVAWLACACGEDYPCDEVRFAQLVKEGL
ncbi:hypothetical protein [Micromonospora zhanjiangensis]|uniref:Uncharacterized protein n=1 Tax=Micromonospora zhanjiangensis TaxID=1522057 RepID=A0ABV8KU00_9ACTN